LKKQISNSLTLARKKKPCDEQGSFFSIFSYRKFGEFSKNLAKLVEFKLEKRKFPNIFPICLPKKNSGPFSLALSLSLAFVDANDCEQ
jgi:hypothetical protein